MRLKQIPLNLLIEARRAFEMPLIQRATPRQPRSGQVLLLFLCL